MTLKRILAAASISGALGVGALGRGAGVANADDGHGPWVPWVPWHPGEIAQEWVGPWIPWQHGDDWHGDGWHGDWEGD